MDSGEEALEKIDAWDAWNEWNTQAQAYSKSATLVTEARRLEQDSQNAALDILQGLAGGGAPSGSIITGTSFLNGLAAGYITRQQNWRNTVKDLTGLAQDARQAAGNATHTAGTQAKNLLLSLVSEAKATVADNRAGTNHIGRWLERLPSFARDGITATLGRFVPANSKYLVKAPAVLKSMSAVGVSLSGISTAVDIASGKNPATTIVNNGAGLITGTATGMALTAGPLGAVGAFLVDTGTTVILNEATTVDPEDKMVIAPGMPSPQPINRPPM